MPRQIIDVTGQTFGRLTALRYSHTTRSASWWVCQCACGCETVKRGRLLRIGATRSCGCLLREHGTRTTHGYTGTREYRSWVGAKNRCYNTRDPKYASYGARGIFMSDPWLNDFMQLRTDMGLCPPGYSLDRIDNDGPYTGPCAAYPNGNCRWAPPTVQANNQRRTHRLTWDGETRTLSEWAQIKGWTRQLLKDRLFRYGWSVERALTTPLIESRRHHPTILPPRAT